MPLPCPICLMEPDSDKNCQFVKLLAKLLRWWTMTKHCARAIVHRSRPHRGFYEKGGMGDAMEEEKGSRRKLDTVGPMQVIIQEDQNVVWVSRNHKLYRVAPEHLRGLSAFEEFRQNVNPEKYDQIHYKFNHFQSWRGAIYWHDFHHPLLVANGMMWHPWQPVPNVHRSRSDWQCRTSQPWWPNSTNCPVKFYWRIRSTRWWTRKSQSIPASQPSDESQSNTREEPNHIEIPVSETSDEDTSETEETGLYVEEELLYNMTSEKGLPVWSWCHPKGHWALERRASTARDGVSRLGSQAPEKWS